MWPGSPELVAEVDQDAGQETRDLHLGHTELGADLVLCLSPEEPKFDEALVAWREPR